MKWISILVSGLLLAHPLTAQIKRSKTSRLDSDPDIVQLQEVVATPIKLRVIREAPVFSDKNGSHRLGFLKADQDVELEAMTAKVYRVRGQGTRNGIAGWVAPWAFSHTEKDFAAKLSQLYERQVTVQKIIASNQIAIGMTLDEVSQSRGKPTKTSVRRTAEGDSGTWEYIDFEEIEHFITRIDPISGQAFRQFSHMTREEKGKSTVEFKAGLVTALEETEDSSSSRVKIIVPPILLGW